VEQILFLKIKGHFQKPVRNAKDSLIRHGKHVHTAVEILRSHYRLMNHHHPMNMIQLNIHPEHGIYFHSFLVLLAD
jgi:hypothetical protein